MASWAQVALDGGAVLDMAAWGRSLLAYSTMERGVAGWDLRVGRDAWTLPALPAAGVVEHFVLDSSSHDWVLTGTSRGQLSLWDMRALRLPVSTWQHPAGVPIAALAQAQAAPQRLGLSEATGPLVYVACGEQEVGLWDVADAKCRQASPICAPGLPFCRPVHVLLTLPLACHAALQVLRVLHPGTSEAARRHVPAALAQPPGGLVQSRGQDMMSRARQLAIAELQTPQTRRECCHALLPTPGGQLLAGSSDCVVRCWDSGRPQQSYVVCTPPPLMPATHAAGEPSGGEGLGPEASSSTAVDVPQVRC